MSTTLRAIIFASFSLAAILVAFYVATARTPNGLQSGLPGVSTPIGVAQMMRDARNLPEQQYDAF